MLSFVGRMGVFLGGGIWLKFWQTVMMSTGITKLKRHDLLSFKKLKKKEKT